MTERVRGYCALCVSRCGSIAVVEDGRFVALEPDPDHPTGQALCAKGRAAPELVYHPERLLHPLVRTRPKGDPDPGWKRVSWDEALAFTATRLRELADESGPETVVFTIASPSTTASSDSIIWIERFMRAFGSPNESVSMELCGWGRYGATMYTYGASVPGAYMPDLERAGCILFWGYNPSLARLTHAVATAAALRRGARLIVVDPRRAGLANKADVWLRVRPGTDGALALGIAHVMIERGWYDDAFIREWTNGPLLVRSDDGRLLSAAHLAGARGGGGGGRGGGGGGGGSGGRGGGEAPAYVAWSEARGEPVLYHAESGRYEAPVAELALSGEYPVETERGVVACRPAFGLVADLCARHPPERVREICGIEPADTERAARLLWESRPVAYYAWSGVEMQTNATQTARAIAQLHALTGCFDVPGGNVLFATVPSANVGGEELLAPERRARTLGLSERPLGPARMQHVTSEEIYRGILERQPYPVRGLVGFGANLLMAHADGRRGHEALSALDFYVHADLFMSPTAELADVVLPVASAFEREALTIGFEVSAEAQSHVQLRRRVVEPRGESRPDTEIVFDLACRLGLGEHFWDGDIEAAYRHRLAPSGVSLEDLRERPGGVRVPLRTRYRKYAEPAEAAGSGVTTAAGDAEGRVAEAVGPAAAADPAPNGRPPRGFATPTRKVELYSQTMLEQGYPPLPEYDAPLVGPTARPDLARRFPLILTCAKHTLFCESQHRALPSLRRRAPDPEVELHPAAAEERGIAAGDWVRIETPGGSVRARARLNDSLEEGVVCGQHGWWQACEEIGAPGYDPLGPEGANYNILIGSDAIDPISGSIPHRAYVCEVRRVES